ncbi:2-amino-4-hydroxy-6-hydroxymethyldihydropteridine diphosphokinase [Virgibacillus sediminis]|uniref:2-amino-4-hydroxy-6-hydroxymethyldihydropteridine diphosphokinase n=1 Tax=Virgibacillus sediminis TaxID=202260 RepID=A0ABV7A7D3_9BACI
MNTAFIALGTNIEPREEHLTSALSLLDGNPYVSIRKRSSIYQTAPVGYTDQDDFLNMVVEIITTKSSLELLEICQSVEKELGRKRDIRWGPRTIDLDILLYNQENSKMERLIIPHPRMHERAFVLIPLHEIAPNLVIPGMDGHVGDFIDRLPESDIRDVKKWTEGDSAEG